MLWRAKVVGKCELWLWTGRVTNLNCVHLNWGIPGWRRFMVLIVVMLENGPPRPSPPLKQVWLPMSGSIIHYVQQHYTINIQKPLLIGRTIVVSSKKKKKMHTIKQQVYREPGAPLFSFSFFFTLKCTESSRKIFSLCRKLSKSGRPPTCVYVYKTIHDKSVCWVSSTQHVSTVSVTLFVVVNILNLVMRVSTVKMLKSSGTHIKMRWI